MSTQSVLIPVFMGNIDIDDDAVQLVNARDLHKFLEIATRFNDWIVARISEYGFIENQDFLGFTENSVKPQGGRPSREYHITLDMAKELAMVERNEKGKQARRYFIACEKRLLEQERIALAAPDSAASIPAAAPTRLALLKEITSNTTRFINSTSKLERETLAVSLCEMNRMAGFAERLNGHILAELNASPYSDPRTEQVITQFWRNYQTLATRETLNHSTDPARIAINLRYFAKACEREGLPLCALSELHRHLKHSKNPLFITGSTPVWSRFLLKAVRCVIFIDNQARV